MRAVIVGPGVMGELMGKAWREVLPEGELVFLGKEGERARFLAERYGGRAAYANSGQRVSECRRVELGVAAAPPSGGHAHLLLTSRRPLT